MMDKFMEVLAGLDWSPLLISLKTGVVATVISFFSRNFCGAQGSTGRGEGQSGCRRYFDTSDGFAADGCGVLPAFVIQQEKAVGNVFI